MRTALRIALPLLLAAVAAPAQKYPNPLKSQLYVVPLGANAEGDARRLAAYLHEKMGVPTKALPVMELNSRSLDASRGQYQSESILQQLRAELGSMAARSHAAVLAVTSADMYTAAINWRFAFATRTKDGFAVVSTARMGLPSLRYPKPAPDVRVERLQKMALKQVALLYFGVPLSENPESILYKDILGLDDLDRIRNPF